MNIRNVEKSDLGPVAALSCLVNKIHVQACPEIYKTISAETAEHLLSARINDCSYVFRLAETGQNTLGYYLAEIHEVQETDLIKAFQYLYLAEIMISPDFQRSGVGSALLTDLKNNSRERKIDRIYLDVSDFNTRALAFFKEQGFDILRERMSVDISI